VRQPIVVDGGRAQVGVSVGFAAMIGPGRGAEQLLRTADRAMYRQKGAPSRAA
jgi:GGDEF domain-containing protein